MKYGLAFCLFICSVVPAHGQLGGGKAFEFLNLPTHARAVGMGGYHLTTDWDDPAQAFYNPALLNAAMDNRLVVNHLNYFASIHNISAGYVHDFGKHGIWSIQASTLNYGEIDSFDEDGFASGSFRVQEYFLAVGHARQFGVFHFGGQLKWVQSDLSAFRASSLMMDFSALFKHPEKNLTAGFLVRHLGFLLNDYTDENNSELPLDVQMGVSFQPEFMPFRFSLTARNLNRNDVVFFDPVTNTLQGQNSEPGFSEEIFRRLVVGVEVLFSDHFQARVGYNHMLKKELELSGLSGGAGLSFGFMFRVKRFEFAYGRALYHAAGGSNSFQMNVNLNGMVKRKEK